jgi:hypothetical protein
MTKKVATPAVPATPAAAIPGLSTVSLPFDRETKNTFRFSEVLAEGVKSVLPVGTIYVNKSAFGGEGVAAPASLTVTLAW